MKTPDITLAQILAALGSIVGLFVSQGLLDNRLEKLITGIAAVVLPLVWVVADAWIRGKRADNAEKLKP